MTTFARRHYETIGDVISERVMFARKCLAEATQCGTGSDIAKDDAVHMRQRLFELGLLARDMSDAFGRDNPGYKPDRFAKRCGLTVNFERDFR